MQRLNLSLNNLLNLTKISKLRCFTENMKKRKSNKMIMKKMKDKKKMIKKKLKEMNKMKPKKREL